MLSLHQISMNFSLEINVCGTFVLIFDGLKFSSALHLCNLAFGLSDSREENFLAAGWCSRSSSSIICWGHPEVTQRSSLCSGRPCVSQCRPQLASTTASHMLQLKTTCYGLIWPQEAATHWPHPEATRDLSSGHGPGGSSSLLFEWLVVVPGGLGVLHILLVSHYLSAILSNLFHQQHSHVL